MSGEQHQQQSFNDRYIALILEESEKIYNKLTTKLTNSVIAAAAASIRGICDYSYSDTGSCDLTISINLNYNCNLYNTGHT
jgi:hypothetical protein